MSTLLIKILDTPLYNSVAIVMYYSPWWYTTHHGGTHGSVVPWNALLNYWTWALLAIEFCSQVSIASSLICVSTHPNFFYAFRKQYNMICDAVFIATIIFIVYNNFHSHCTLLLLSFQGWGGGLCWWWGGYHMYWYWWVTIIMSPVLCDTVISYHQI